MRREQQQLSSNGVIITVYEELPTNVKSSHRGKEKIKVRKSTPRKSCGYDRRAELLAYVHHLRNVNTNEASQQIYQDHSPTDSMPQPKKKRRSFASLKNFRLPFGRLFRRKNKEWRYENIDSSGSRRRYRTCHQGRSQWSKMSKKLRHFMKEFSSGWKCSK